MTPEQKAEAYDKALERAKKYNSDDMKQVVKDLVTYIFPELKESEDEKIRKALIDFFYRGAENGEQTNGVCDKDILAWLEKQNGHIDEEKILIGARKGIALSIMNFLDKNTTSMCLSNMECEDLEDAVIDSDWARIYFYMKKNLEKQVEPKFHEGDWVILSLVGEKDKLVQVQTIEYFPSEQPKYITTDGKWFGNGHNARLWTIKDAKPGDVLVSEFGKPFIFKDCSDTKHPNAPVAYCGINYANNFIISVGRWWASGKVYPATKEQRETLLKAMTDAGHTFDFEKKELKKIEQNPAWCEEDDIILNDTFDILNSYYSSNDDISLCDKINKIENWLISIKDRVQPKQERSEENEKILDEVITNYESGYLPSVEKRDEIIEKLKSLKERYTWKPSEEQMDALETAISSLQSTSLESLYNELEKL